jgi:hypothetical protein
MTDDTPMTPAEFAAEMQQCEAIEPECGHMAADELIIRLLRSLGYTEGADIFDRMMKWYA